MNSSSRSQWKNSNLACLKRKQKWPLFQAVFITVFFSIWYYNLMIAGEVFEKDNLIEAVIEWVKSEPFILIFLLAPLVILVLFVRQFFTGRKICFNVRDQMLRFNSRTSLPFEQIKSVLIRHRKDKSGRLLPGSGLILVTKQGRGITLLRSTDHSALSMLASEIAAILHVNIDYQ